MSTDVYKRQGVNGSVFQSWLNSKSADGLGFVDAITGGSFSQMSVFALNITPVSYTHLDVYKRQILDMLQA